LFINIPTTIQAALIKYLVTALSLQRTVVAVQPATKYGVAKLAMKYYSTD
jgi:hypothetical protein